tara:strand:- start:308 stop:484 length:177 start_codon:yes stop_codon:yes gene_type:complete
MRMNNESKLVFALEHIAHLEDLIEGNELEKELRTPLYKLKYEFEKQLDQETLRKQKRH